MDTPWTKIKEIYAYRGWRNIIQKFFKMPDEQEAVFDVVDNGDYVTVAAFTEDGAAILVRQFRPGPETNLVSFPEGYIDKQETPEQAARRELLEETGYQAGQITYLKTFRRAYSTETRICLLAENCRLTTKQDLDQQEFIEVFTLDQPAFRSYLKNEQDECFTTVDAGYLALEKLDLI